MNGVPATLVGPKLDRLTRDPRVFGTLRDARVPFVAADSPHATELTVDILAAVAVHRTAERTRVALAVKKARGARCSAGVPISGPEAAR